ncbi:MAG: hypothetical protein CMH53_00865 [Myxococcales bacterium]|nr:hypothetical protein [Myxococcales bacterium]
MTAALMNSMHERLDGVHAQYHLHFAGQPRVTRNEEMMRLMIEQANSIHVEAQDLSPHLKGLDDLLKLCLERLELYRGEVTEIERAKEQVGPSGVEAAMLGTRANFVFARYRRHFAGRSRSTRDLALLMEMTRDLQRIHEQMSEVSQVFAGGTLARDMEVVGEYIEMFRSEHTEIGTSRGSGSQDEQASALAALANEQFEWYRLHFAGQPRVSRRPELLERMISGLETVLERMRALKDNGFHVQYNDDNLQVVTERLGMWRQEIIAIRDVRSQTPLLSMVEALSEAVDVVLELYNERFAGQNRATRDVELLCALCDRLCEIERQMEKIATVQPLTANERNLEMARDALGMLEEEWSEVSEAQANND